MKKIEIVENILQYEQGGIKWTKYCKDSEGSVEIQAYFMNFEMVKSHISMGNNFASLVKQHKFSDSLTYPPRGKCVCVHITL